MTVVVMQHGRSLTIEASGTNRNCDSFNQEYILAGQMYIHI